MRLLFSQIIIGVIFLCASSSFAHELQLIFYRAPKPLDWSTPGSLVRSAFHNSFFQLGRQEGDHYRYDIYPHGISHVNIRLQCGDEPAVYRGMTSDRSTASYAWDLMVRGRSLETFLIDVKGRFYKNEEVLKWLPTLEAQGYVRRLKIKINEDQCRRAQNYLRQYEALNLQKVYGSLRADPLWGHGSGCAAFAVSFLRILNLFPEDLAKHWRRHLLVPISLLSSQSRVSEIGFWGYMRGKNSAWAKPSQAHIVLDFFDPELMYKWVGPRQQVVWDVRDHETPDKLWFRMSVPQIKKNHVHRIEQLNELLSEKELRDPFYFECRTWGYCN